MNAERVARRTALVSGVLLALALIGTGIAGAAPFGGAGTASWQMGPGMMGAGQVAAAAMGHGMGHGMMGFGSSAPAPTAIPGAADVRVQTVNFGFSPSEIRLPKGADVNLTLVNPATTATVHDLSVPALGIHLVVNAGETRTTGLRALAAGRYEAFCAVPGHADLGMRATIVVE